MSDKTTAVTAWEALFRAQVSVMRYLNAEFPTGELSLNEYDVLFNLSRQPGRQLRMKELNRHLLLTQPSVSRLVDRLVSRGLLEKSHDQDDARGVNVALTLAGFELFRTVARSHIQSIAERVGGILSTAELETLTELCDRLRLADRK
ncbi:MarR family winged helix-turn-helix transcriptional regulator [Glaciihabitans sp. GrIS 2.15]|uniref:MarR family winged helix-turn-helix transcriptional regulator n=1 Tax=Glaciihabitans sp. GrIS 2.15 TaxID=3071710 RepID=UPI002DF76F09|nr:DNA-binding MarR family transcriptional regulator [Glaciihabitans sp. GrIS 2.15]